MIAELAALHPAITAIPVGVAFGVVLERVGLGDPHVIREQLLGRDFTVVIVMFGAIVTALLGLRWLDVVGVTNIDALAVPPTDLGAQVVGGIVFGGGFAIASLCPGTACVAAASGRRDGVAAVGGVFLGTAITPAIWPVIGKSAAQVPDEGRVLSADLGLPVWGIAALLVVALLAVIRVHRHLQRQASAPPWWHVNAVEAVALTLALAYAAVERAPRASEAHLATLATAIEREEDHVDALDLAEWIREGRRDMRILDLREGVDTGTYTIPGAQVVSLGALPSISLDPSQVVILYSDGGAHAAQGWVLLKLRGVSRALVLKDGMAAWEDEILSPELPAGDDAATRDRVARIRALSLWFGGQPRVGDGTFRNATRASEGARPRRRRTC